jgi:hypothetical protein
MTVKIVLFEYKGVTETVTSQDQDELLSITCGVYMFGRTPQYTFTTSYIDEEIS